MNLKKNRYAFPIRLAPWLLAALAVCAPAQEAQKLPLADAVALALQYSPELAVARTDIRAAEARTMQAAAFAAPELTLAWDAMPAFFKPAGADESSVGLRQTFEFPLKRKHRLEALGHGQRLAESRLQNVQKLLVARVKRAYFQALFAREQIANLEKAAGWLEQFAGLAASRYAAQNGTYLEVLRARVEAAKLNSELIGWQGEFAQNLAALNRLLGNPGPLPLILTDHFSEPPFGRTLDQEIGSRLPLNSLLLQARAQVSRQRSFVNQSRSGFWPDFSLAVSRQRLNGQPPYDANGYFGSRSHGWAIELGFSLPFLWGKGPRAEIMQARAGLDKAETILAANEKDVRSAIERDYQKVKTAEAQVGVFRDSLLADSRDQLQAGLDLYRLNRIDSWQLLDVLRSDMEIHNEYSRALYRFNLALADLEAAGEAENSGEENEE
jgi:cobalt-zinc-cadmium efflux system outer membrane protein